MASGTTVEQARTAAFSIKAAHRPAAAWREWAPVVALVAALHAAALFAWSMRPPVSGPAAADGVVTVSLEQPAASEPVLQEGSRHAIAVQETDAAVPAPSMQEAVPQPAAAPGPAGDGAAAGSPDAEPDYRAAYLNNPLPAYPTAARRRGLQGRVVLHVEVLADGTCGQVDIRQSSGYEILDHAALQTVKGWRFVPASHLGQATAKWVLVPIQFSLKDEAA